ncbi:DUF4253 domain-containing protein [Streptomyces sp. FH025]|uniref:DUF4253 domain-containing protein n=1 Tax=Streptomyces sp. FH025 TaxID=2815937 RepID=UPI001A9FD109|nr:DUF4253 domain-containing protein [Streptomyces sp. FH025]MBO1419112.1 DUF4253 domain-containing protein [Streptomyces sp. FH025]
MTWPFDVAPPVALPPGRPVVGEEGEGERPLLWISDGPAPAGLWEQLHRAHPQSGLWPLLLSPLHDGDDFRPWLSGELYPDDASDPADHDPAALLRAWWEPEGPEDEDESAKTLAPYGAAWPGLAPAAAVPEGAADAQARELAGAVQSFLNVRLGLVPAAGGAQALVACGWSGPLNHESDTAKIAAVLTSWERRFGAQVVEVGFATLQLSVPTPPATLAEALPLAAEHVAFCPDQVYQGAGTLTAYAERLVGSHHWYFWWD